MAGGFEKAPVVILGSIDWDAAWQRHQIFAAQWAAAGHDVFFVENLGFRNPRLSDWKRLAARARRLFAGQPAASRNPRPKKVRVVSPAVLPPTFGLFRALNAAVFAPRLVRRLRETGLKGPCLVVAYLPTQTTLDLIDELAPVVCLYDCVDNFAGHPTPPEDLERTERALMDRCGLVLTTSSTLFEARSKDHRRVRELHQGAPESFFIDAPLRRSHKRLCYFGTLWSALDYEAVGALIQAGYEVELIGPQKEPLPPLPAGVALRPPLPHDKLPAALRRCDGLILPYRQTEYNKGVVPAKLYECLATGLPVIASPIPALKPFKDVLRLAEGPRQWVEAARALDEDTAQARERRLALARAHRQSEVFARLREEARTLWQTPGREALPPRPLTRTRAFVNALAWLGSLSLAGQAVVWVTLLAAARWLGPRQFGQAAVALAAAALLAVPPVLGFPAAMGRLGEDDERARNRLISAGLLLFLLSAALWLTVLAVFAPALADALGLSEVLFNAAAFAGYALALDAVAASPLWGLGKFARRGAVELLAAAALPVALWAASTAGAAAPQALVLAWGAAALAAALASLASLAGRLRLGLDGPSLARCARGLDVSFLQAAGAALAVAFPPILLARFESWAAAGLYAAYFFVCVGPSLAAGRAVGAVVGPVAETSAPGAPWRALGWAAAPGCALLAALAFAAAAAAFPWLRPQFTFSAVTAAWFSAAAGLAALQAAVAAQVSAEGPGGRRLAAAGRGVGGVATGWLSWTLVAPYSVNGAAAALSGGFAASLLFFGLVDGLRRLA